MRLKIKHTTRYSFDSPVAYGLQQVRVTPKATRAQTILNWSTQIQGAHKELSFVDHWRNHVDLVSFDIGTTAVTLTSEGEVEVADSAGVLGPHEGFAPLWLFQRGSALTRPGKACRELARQPEGETLIDRLHALSHLIAGRVEYKPGLSDTDWNAEDVLAAGHGVCQDHTHVFVTCARLMGAPARYVSGYLMMDDRIEQDAMHAWAEAHVTGLGWVGFDVSNGISPDQRYVRVATGLDYVDAAPVSGTRFGQSVETLNVGVEVTQQQ